MADLNQLETALRNADAAGDAQAAQMLAGEIRRLRSAPPASPSDTRRSGASGSWDKPKPRGSILDAVGEPIVQLATGAVATPIAGIAGLLSTPFTNDPARIVDKVSNALTIQPGTQYGQAGSRVLSYPFEKLAQGADWAGQKVVDATGSPAAGAAVNTAVQMLPAVVLRGRVGNGRGSPQRPNPSVAAGEVEAPRPSPPQSGRNARLEGVPEKPPSIDELKTQAQEAYKRADEAGITVSAPAIKGLKVRIATELNKDGLDKTLHPGTSAALKRVLESKGDLKLSEVETLRKIASDARATNAPADARLAGKVVDHIDDFLENLDEGQVISGNAAAAGALKEARGLYQRQKKAEDIASLIERAKISAQGFSGSGFENALRTEFRALAKNQTKMRRFTPEERAAITKVATGGGKMSLENLTRYIGKLAPTGGLSTYLGLGMTAAVPGAVAIPAVGGISRIAATKLTLRNAKRAEELMRRGPQNNTAPQRQKNALADQ